MSQIENLSSTDAIKKLKELAEGADVCVFVTSLTQLPLSSRPMSTLKVDDNGTIWFFSNDKSDKTTDIREDNRVQLFYSNKGSAEYLSVYGEATLLKDKEKIAELWSPIAKAWFPEGKDDPNISIIKVVPQDAYYWDTKGNKMTALLKIAIAAISGKPSDDGGVQGHLNV